MIGDLLAAGAPCHSRAGLGPPALAPGPRAAGGGTRLVAAQLPMQFYHLDDCNDENNSQMLLGGRDVTVGLGHPEPALSLGSCWGSAVLADHFCHLPMAAQLRGFASSPGFRS